MQKVPFCLQNKIMKIIFGRQQSGRVEEGNKEEGGKEKERHEEVTM